MEHTGKSSGGGGGSSKSSSSSSYSGSSQHMVVQPVHRVPCEFPVPYLWACCCGPCFAGIHRIEALGDRWPADYYLCQNMLEDLHPKCVFCPRLANDNPYLCLCFEAFCLTGGAIGGSRYHLQKKYGKEDTPMEKFCGICLAISVFCGVVGAMWTSFFDSCLGVQQVKEMQDKGDSTKQPCFW